MRIVQILSDLSGHPAGRSTLDLAQELVRLGHELTVISGGGEQVARLTLRGSRHIEMPLHKGGLRSLRLVGRLRRLFLELQPDVIHVRDRLPAWLVWLAWRRLPAGSRPRLVTAVDRLYPNSFYSGILAVGERVIAASQLVADSLQANFSKKLLSTPRVIHRGVNTREFDRSAPISGHWHLRLLNDYPQLEGKYWLLLPAPLTPEGGQREFLQMLAALASEREDVFGLLVGDSESSGKYARHLEQLALQLGLSDKVLFLGQRRDMREIYASAQITYSLPAGPLSVDTTATEALAMNCPVVTYRDGASGEIVQQCFPQGLVNRNDISALVTTTLEVLDRPRQIDFRGFSLEETASQTLALYRELCEPTPTLATAD